MGITVGVATGVRLEAVIGAAEGLTSGVAVEVEVDCTIGVMMGCIIGVMMGCTIGIAVLALTCLPGVSSGARIMWGFHNVGSAMNCFNPERLRNVFENIRSKWDDMAETANQPVT
jgi:hypothetical protein